MFIHLKGYTGVVIDVSYGFRHHSQTYDHTKQSNMDLKLLTVP